MTVKDFVLNVDILDNIEFVVDDLKVGFKTIKTIDTEITDYGENIIDYIDDYILRKNVRCIFAKDGENGEKNICIAI